MRGLSFVPVEWIHDHPLAAGLVALGLLGMLGYGVWWWFRDG